MNNAILLYSGAELISAIGEEVLRYLVSIALLFTFLASCVSQGAGEQKGKCSERWRGSDVKVVGELTRNAPHTFKILYDGDNLAIVDASGVCLREIEGIGVENIKVHHASTLGEPESFREKAGTAYEDEIFRCDEDPGEYVRGLSGAIRADLIKNKIVDDGDLSSAAGVTLCGRLAAYNVQFARISYGSKMALILAIGENVKVIW